jgi:hypothetical protein
LLYGEALIQYRAHRCSVKGLVQCEAVVMAL